MLTETRFTVIVLCKIVKISRRLVFTIPIRKIKKLYYIERI